VFYLFLTFLYPSLSFPFTGLRLQSGIAAVPSRPAPPKGSKSPSRKKSAAQPQLISDPKGSQVPSYGCGPHRAFAFPVPAPRFFVRRSLTSSQFFRAGKRSEIGDGQRIFFFLLVFSSGAVEADGRRDDLGVLIPYGMALLPGIKSRDGLMTALCGGL
jgi:hypothetical protein